MRTTDLKAYTFTYLFSMQSIYSPMLSSTHIVNNPRWLVVLAAYLKCVKTLCNQQVPETWPIIDVSDDFVKKTIEKDEMASYLVSCAESYTAFMNKDWRTALRWSTMAIPSFRNDKHLIPKILLDFPMVRFVGVIAAIQLLIHNETMVRRSQKQKKEEQGNRVHPSTGQNASSPPNNSSLHVVMSKPEKQALLTLANNGKNFFKKLAASQATSAVNHAHKYQFILAGKYQYIAE